MPPKVTLIAYTQPVQIKGFDGIPIEQLLAAEKRICNTIDNFEDILTEQMFGKDKKLKEKRLISAIKDKHLGLFEHISFTFLIEDISRIMTHQLVRHRMASYLQLSQRATSMNDIRFIYPSSYPEYLKNEVLINYIDLGRKLYNILIENNVPMEDARCIMPHGMETRIIMTINGRSLIHFLKLRLDEHAQWEIREVANQIWNLIKQICPTVFDEKYKEYWE